MKKTTSLLIGNITVLLVAMLINTSFVGTVTAITVLDSKETTLTTETYQYDFSTDATNTATITYGPWEPKLFTLDIGWANWMLNLAGIKTGEYHLYASLNFDVKVEQEGCINFTSTLTGSSKTWILNTTLNSSTDKFTISLKPYMQLGIYVNNAKFVIHGYTNTVEREKEQGTLRSDYIATNAKGEPRIVDGFAEIDSYANIGNKLPQTVSYWEYAEEDDECIEWKTDVVPQNYACGNVTFVWYGAYGNQTGFHDLHLNDKKILTFCSNDQKEDTLWENGSYKLFFDYQDAARWVDNLDLKDGSSDKEHSKYESYSMNESINGVYYLTVPASELNLGEQQSLKVVGVKNSKSSKTWLHKSMPVTIPGIPLIGHNDLGDAATHMFDLDLGYGYSIPVYWWYDWYTFPSDTVNNKTGFLTNFSKSVSVFNESLLKVLKWVSDKFALGIGEFIRIINIFVDIKLRFNIDLKTSIQEIIKMRETTSGTFTGGGSENTHWYGFTDTDYLDERDVSASHSIGVTGTTTTSVTLSPSIWSNVQAELSASLDLWVGYSDWSYTYYDPIFGFALFTITSKNIWDWLHLQPFTIPLVSGIGKNTANNTETIPLGTSKTIYFNPTTITNTPPNPVLSADTTSITVGSTVIFDASSSTDADGDILWYYFDFGDGYSSGYKQIPTVTHAYNQWGDHTYTAKLYVWDGKEESSVASAINIVVDDPYEYSPPTANLWINKTWVNTTELIKFDASNSTVDSYWAYGKYYCFDFEDGYNTGWITTPVVYHNYTKRGIYETTLYVTDGICQWMGYNIPSAKVKIWVGISQVPEGSILVVVDDENINTDPISPRAAMETALRNTMYADSFIYYVVGDTNNDGVFDATGQNGPSYAYMKEFDAVIWFTGVDWSNTLTSTDQQNIKDYLDNGGKLWLIGQDILYNLYGAGNHDFNSGDFAYDYLHIDYVYNDKGTPNPLYGLRSFSGLKGEYYDNKDLTKRQLSRIDSTINFDWGSGAPNVSIGSDTFSVRWTGRVRADYPETYTFYTHTDDGVKLWVDDNLIIDKWQDQAATEWSGSTWLSAGWHKIKMEYYENTGSAVAKLRWSSPYVAKEIIPQDHLEPPVTDLIDYFTCKMQISTQEICYPGTNLSYNQYGDFIASTDSSYPSYVREIFYGYNDGYKQANGLSYYNSNNNARLVFFPFEFATIQNGDDREEVAYRVITWLTQNITDKNENFDTADEEFDDDEMLGALGYWDQYDNGTWFVDNDDYSKIWVKAGMNLTISLDIDQSSIPYEEIFSEDFEDATFPEGNWTTYDLNSASGYDYWDDRGTGQSPPGRAHSGSWAAYCADVEESGRTNYDDNMDAYMVYGPININSYASVKLEFYLWLKSETGWDYFYAGYYDTTWHWPYSKDGDISGWKFVSVDIPISATKVGFRFYSDSSITYEGAYVDDIVLNGSYTNFDIYLYDTNKNLINSSTTTSIHEEAFCIVNTTGYYYAQTHRVNGYGYYVWSVDIASDGNDWYSTAWNIASGENVTQYLYQREDWSDWYKVYVSASQAVVINMTVEEETNDFGLYLYNASLYWADGEWYGSQKSVGAIAEISGYYYIWAYCWEGNGKYTLNVWVGSPPPSDGNDESTSASEISLDTNLNASISSDLNKHFDRFDWYKIYLNSGEKIIAQTTGATNTDFDLYLFYNSSSCIDIYNWTQYLAYSLNSTSNEKITTTVYESGYYYVLVYSYRGIGAYSLKITIYDLTPPTSSVDAISLYWYNAAISITSTGTDARSGVKEVALYYRYSTYNSTWNEWRIFGTNDTTSPYEWLFNAPDGDGYYQFYSTATDNAYNIESKVTIAEAIAGYDTVAPTTTNDAPAGWQASFVEVTIMPSDTTSGVNATYYKIWLNNTTEPSSWSVNPTGSGTEISLDSDGIWNIAYYSDDVAGNTELIKNVTVKIDKTNPEIIIEGVIDGFYYNVSVTPVIDITDINLNTTIVTLNGEPFISDTTIIADGDYLLFVQAIDKAGNTAEMSISFSIDKIKPDISITGVVDEVYYNTSVTSVIEITDLNLNTTLIMLNGEIFTSGTTITDEGDYVLYVHATDKANNTATKTVSFTIDKTKPDIDITGVANNTYYNTSVTPVIEVLDINLNSSIVTLNGVSFASGTTVTEDGYYILMVQATDKAGNTMSVTLLFTIDKILPEITVTGVADNAYYNISVTPVIEITDSNLNITSITLNGNSFTSGDAVSEEGNYILFAQATDKAGNTASKVVSFIIDKTLPSISISGVTDDSYHNTDVTPIIDVIDTNINMTTITLNGDPFSGGTIVSVEDEYTLIIHATDKAGNKASETISFTIDKTNPRITITGVADGSYYNIDITPIIDVVDSNLNIISITLNGNIFINGMTVSTENTYVLVVQATDKAGNSATKTITFVVDKTAPAVTVTESSQITKEKTFTMHWLTTANDVLYYEISTDGIIWENVSMATQHTFTLSKGDNTLYVRGTDFAGNKGTDTVTVTYMEKKEEPKGFIPGFEAFLLLIVLTGYATLGIKRRKRKTSQPQSPSQQQLP